MTVDEFVDSVPNFLRLAYVEQIKRFCWYLSCVAEKSSFSGTEVAQCFAASRCSKPSAISPFLDSLTKQKPPFLMRRGRGYELSRHAHDQFDSLLGKRPATIAVDNALADLPSKLSIDFEKIYLDEALTCFRHGALRAAIVMTWNLVYDHLCNVIVATKLTDFNSQLPKSFPKADIAVIAKKEDFESLKESQVLQVAKSANIITGGLYKILKEKLDRRNLAAHPSNIVIAQHTAEEFIIDLIENAVLKLQLP